MRGETKILIIGNSFVEGVGAQDNFGWAQRLKNQFPEIEFTLSGVGGDNIEKLLSRVDSLPAMEFDVVILEVGINDSRYRPSKNSEEISLPEFIYGVKRFASLFRNNNEGIKLFLVGLTRVNEKLTTPYKEDKHYLNANIENYDEALKEIASQIGAIYLSVPPLDSWLRGYLADGIHPSDKGHKAIYQSVVKQLEAHRIV